MRADEPWGFGRRTTLASLALIAAAVAVLMSALASVASGDRFPTESSGVELNVTSFRWEEQKGSVELKLSPGQTDRLRKCGTDEWEESLLARAPDGIAYCIEPLVRSDPGSMVTAYLKARELTNRGAPFTANELNYLRLAFLAAFADPDSVEAAQYRELQLEVWGELSPAEKQHVNA
jgi:hypothetical protein